jgi:hypothetical protein
MNAAGLVGDDVCAQPTTNRLPATTATATHEGEMDMETPLRSEQVDD